jgi:hypothetical protein
MSSVENKNIIVRNRVLPESQNFEFLRKLGLKYIEKFSSKLWTDYNVHDPGIHTLEVLSYALTDLGYRTNFDIKDLLTRDASDKTIDFFKTQEIFACNPTTFDDYRKWLIDIKGIENAWVKKYEGDYFTVRCEPIQQKATINPSPVLSTDEGRKINGLYEIKLQLEEDGILGDLNLTEIDFEIRNASSVRLAIVKFIFPLEIKKTYPKVQDERITKLQQIADIEDFTFVEKPNNTFDITFKKGLETITILNCKLHFQLLSSVETLANIRSKLINDLSLGNAATKKRYIVSVFDIYLQKVKKSLSLIDEAYCKMQRFRNLCEDVYSISLVQTQQLAVCADIDVEAGVDLEEIMGQMLYEVDTFFSPPVRFYSLKELYEQGLSTEDIFEGKSYDLNAGNLSMTNGFIKDDELNASDLKTEVRLSDIYRIIMGIKGVKAVTKLQITNYLNGNAIETIGENGKWVLNLTGGFHLNLDRLRSKILFYRDNLPLFADKQVAQRIYDDLKMLHKKNRFADEKIDVEIPKGKYLDLSDYYSIQNDYPLVYGIGRDGLADSETPFRKAQAKQFKAYLLFFDQVLANYLSQLSHVKDLFSINYTANQSYSYQKVYDGDVNFPNTLELLNKPKYDAELGDIIEMPESSFERKNRFLDHLLARFAEQFSEYAFMMYQLTGNQSEKDKKLTAEVIASDKQDFLKSYGKIGRDRGKAIQYKVCKDSGILPAFDTDDISGLQLRAGKLLGFDESKNIRFFKPTTLTVFESPAGKWQFSYQGVGMSKPLDSDKKDYLSEEKAWEALENTIMLIDLHDPENNHEFIKITGSFEINIVDNNNKLLAKTTAFASNAAAKDEEKKIQEAIQKEFMNEGMHIFEHLLLRPLPFTKVVTDILVGEGYYPMCDHQSPDCDECHDDDYYSFRISVILPYWCRRFRNMNFRKFAENLIHQETPAHILPKFCWISMKQMHDLEKAYQEWFDLNQKPIPNFILLEPKLTELIKKLNKLVNIYPVGFLHDCSNPGDRNSVVLGQTSLGSFEEV